MDREASEIVDFGDKLVSLGNFIMYIRLHPTNCKTQENNSIFLCINFPSCPYTVINDSPERLPQ